jgi:hypothetical protein
VASRKKRKWNAGDIFLIPLRDKTSIIGHILGRSAGALGGLAICLYDVRGHWNSENLPPNLDSDRIFSVLATTPDFLESGRWPVTVSDAIHSASLSTLVDVKALIGQKIRGSELVENFVNAFYGLEPWDDWYIPDYLDAFLISIDKKPLDRLIFCGRHKAL